jgi:protein-glutamine gamma-glutamyltransferase
MKKADLSPPQSTINALIIALSIGTIPHIIYQPAWVGMMFVIMISWRLLHHWKGWPLPAASRWLKMLHNGTALLTIVMLIAQFGLTIGRDAGAALLTMMLAFKVVEIRSLRDFYLSCFLGFFLVITNFFYSQSVFMVMLMLIVVIALGYCLLSVNSQASALNIKQRLWLSSKLVLQATPMMLFLFVLFPRISGPIWGLPQDANASQSAQMTEQLTLGDLPPSQGMSGINDQIQMGKISQLIQSDAIAFRVKFTDNELSPTAKLYWRGPVLWQTDGTVWSPIAEKPLQSQHPHIQISGSSYHYQMTLEPHNKTWLFALDFPTEQPQTLASHLTSDGQLNSDKPIKQRTQYSLTSSPSYTFNAAAEPNLDAALQLPEGKHPQTLALAKQWQQQTDTPQQYINTALAFFKNDGFVYSLSPPRLSGDTVDQFLFQTREGFCEHYAASFTVLMRAAGIPARIVTGYLGGDLNPVDDVLTVRQRDAHAWTEVWLPQQGWLRIDPTSAVSQQRIDQGIGRLLPPGRQSPAMLGDNNQLVAAWNSLKNNWNAFNTAWDMWVVSFGPERQLELLSKLGMSNPNWQKMTIVLTLLFVLTGLVMMLSVWFKRPHHDPGVVLYQRFCKKLARLGIEKADHEGPQDFAMRAQAALPEYHHQIDRITSLFTAWRYRQQDEQTLSSLREQIKAFTPKR